MPKNIVCSRVCVKPGELVRGKYVYFVYGWGLFVGAVGLRT